jgi:hypothetical protein
MNKIEEMSDKEYKEIIEISEAIAESLIVQFTNTTPKGATCLQLGIMKALSVVWASCCSADPKLIFESLMATMPAILQKSQSKYIN